MIMRLFTLFAIVSSMVIVTVAGPPVSPAWADPGSTGTGESLETQSLESQPPSVSPEDIRFVPRVLRTGTPRQVGLLPQYVDRMATDAEAYLLPTNDHPAFPTYAGAVVLAAKDGVVVQRAAVGTAVRYSAVGPAPGRVGVELPAEEQIPTRPDTIFDLASVSKLFTTVVLMQQVEDGLVELDAPVARYVPEFAANGKETITIRMLLTHTSGLPAWAPLWSAYPDPAARRAAALASPLATGATPGGQYVYSDLGLISLGVVVERVTGQPLDEVVRAGITGPLSMSDTGYNPGPDKRPRIAATEYQPYAGRGMVWGEVHDENAWALGGVAGHAGVFSTADDLAVFCQMLLNGGRYGRVRILRESTVRSMLVNYNASLESRYPESDRGLGFELNKHWYMDAMASPVTFGHTGFTGTTLVIDPLSRSFVILLSNRVHPDRAWGGNNPARRAMARDFADAMPVRPLGGGSAWRAQRRDATTVTLTAPLRTTPTTEVSTTADPADGATARFLLWYDTEPRYDQVRVESSADGGTTWSPVTLRLRPALKWWSTSRWQAEGMVTGYGGRCWWRVSATLPPGTTHLRWSYAADGSAQGRGVYVDRVRVQGPDGVLFDGDRGDAGSFQADGWALADG